MSTSTEAGLLTIKNIFPSFQHLSLVICVMSKMLDFGIIYIEARAVAHVGSCLTSSQNLYLLKIGMGWRWISSWVIAVNFRITVLPQASYLIREKGCWTLNCKVDNGM